MSNRDDIIKKIRALLQMTTERGCSEAEAMFAAQKVDTLMQEYKLTFTDLNEIKTEEYGFSGKVFQRGFRKRYRPHVSFQCIQMISQFCEVKWLIQRQFLVFFGTKTNTELAHYMVDMVRSVMEASWKAQEPILKKQFNSHGTTLRTAFMYGMAFRINERLQEILNSRNETIGNNALIVLKGQELEERWQAAGGSAENTKKRQVKLHANALEAGRKAGDKVNLGRPVEGSSSDLKKLA